MSNDGDFEDMMAGWLRDETGPPKRHAWDDYALEKINSHLTGEEIYIEDRNGTCWVYMGVGAFMIGGAFYQVYTNTEGSIWPLVSFSGGVIFAISAVAIRVIGSIELRRISRLRRHIERVGIRAF